MTQFCATKNNFENDMMVV